MQRQRSGTIGCVMTPSAAAVTRQAATAALRQLLDQDQIHLTTGTWAGGAPEGDALGLALATFTHAWSVVVLAETAKELHIPAAVNTRSAWETALMSAWLLQPVDELERTRRWLGYKLGSARHMGNLAKELSKGVSRPAAAAANAAAGTPAMLQEQARLEGGVQETLDLNPGIGPPIPVPSVEARAAALDREKQYFLYRVLSPYAHGEDWLLRDLRTQAEETCTVAYRSKEADWYIPLMVAAEAVWLANEAAATRVGDAQVQQKVMRPAWDAFIARATELGNSTL
jgi:hypothetical protein